MLDAISALPLTLQDHADLQRFRETAGVWQFRAFVHGDAEGPLGAIEALSLDDVPYEAVEVHEPNIRDVGWFITRRPSGLILDHFPSGEALPFVTMAEALGFIVADFQTRPHPADEQG